jgi:hypothetical protein
MLPAIFSISAQDAALQREASYICERRASQQLSPQITADENIKQLVLKKMVY